MADSKLLDESVRDFITGSKDPATLLKPTFVMAGAGAGKTTSIKERVLNLILHHDVSPREMVIITYTVKAAQELNTRIREIIETQLKKEQDASKKQKLMKALDELALARISTVHSFCQELLLEYPIEFQVDPSAKMLDTKEGQFLMGNCQNEFLKHFMLQDSDHYKNHEEAFKAFKILLDQGAESSSIFNAFQILYNNRDLKPKRVDFNFHGRKEMEESIMDLFQSLISDLKQRDKLCKDKTDKLYLNSEDYLNYAKNINEIEDFIKFEFRRTLFGLTEGNQKNWPAEWFTEFKTKRKEFRSLFDSWKLLAQASLYNYLITAYEGYSKLVEDYKQENGLIDFFDCLLLVRNVLRDNKFLRETIQKQFKVFIIDEFQDSDPIQSEIAKLLAEDCPSKLMFVGDGKQAIYGFARSDIDVFRAMSKTVKDEFKGELVELSTNFRSEEKQLDFINKHFADILQEDYGVMHVSPSKKNGKGLVSSLALKVLLSDETDLPGSPERRDREAFLVCKKIKQMIEKEGRKPQDFLLLFRKSTPMSNYEEMLTLLGIPVLNTKSRDYLRQEQAMEILSIMGYFLFPENSYFAYAISNASFTDGKIPEVLIEISKSDLGIRTKLREAINAVGITHTAKVLGDPTYLELTEYLLSAYETEVGLMKGNYTQAFLQLYNRASDENFSFESDEKIFYDKLVPDAVRLMTIHSSKGLEAPVVFLIAHDSKDNQSSSVCVDREKGEVYPVNDFIGKDVLKAYQLGDLNALLVAQDNKRLEEEKRVLYVACTRSEQELHLVYCDEMEISTFMEPLSKFMKGPTREILAFEDYVDEYDSLPKYATTEPKSSPEIKFDKKAFASIAREKIGTPAVTTLIAAPELFRSSKGFGMEFGSFAHKVMETVSHFVHHGKSFQIEDLFKKISDVMDYELDEKETSALKLAVEKFMASETCRKIKEAKSIYSEINFCLPQEYHGIIDLVVENKDGSILIVDFKTDVLEANEASQKIKEHYKKQVDLYVKGLSSLGKDNVSGECYYLMS